MTEARPFFNQINIVSRDPEASLAFYRLLGLEVPEENIWTTGTGTHHISAVREGTAATYFDIDSAPFAPHWNQAWAGRSDLAGKVVIGFGVPDRSDVDATYARLTEAGYAGLQPPFDGFWGARYAIVEDPDGIAVGIMSPMSAAHRAPPPDV
jgi:catechol 2,3-dioxygenase-like lactoylglutathione lyase family enzyme